MITITRPLSRSIDSTLTLSFLSLLLFIEWMSDVYIENMGKISILKSCEVRVINFRSWYFGFFFDSLQCMMTNLIDQIIIEGDYPRADLLSIRA